MLVQLRLNHFPCNEYLHCFNRAESPTCPHCGRRVQMIAHLLTYCDGLVEEQAELRETLGAAATSLQALLTPGKATSHLVEYLSKIRARRDEHETR
jgi:hypothetical protein